MEQECRETFLYCCIKSDGCKGFSSAISCECEVNLLIRKNVKGDPVDFLSWLLNALHLALNGTKKSTSSIIYRSFHGAMKIYSRKIPPVELDDRQKAELLKTFEYQETVSESPFLYLTCDLPPPPLFQDEFRENIIPQVFGTNLKKSEVRHL
jgi:hypothetical protein